MTAWRIGIITTLVVLLSLLCVGGAWAYELRPEDAGFSVAAETERRTLLFNANTLQFRLVDNATGKTWDTCVMNGKQGNKTVKNNQKSTLVATFISNAQNATTNNMEICPRPSGWISITACGTNRAGAARKTRNSWKITAR